MENTSGKIWNVIERIAKTVVFWLLGLFKIEISEKQWETFMQFVKFAMVGVTNFAISYVTYALCIILGTSYHIGNIMGFLISVLNSFYWNNKYVFKTEEGEHRSWWKVLLKTYVSYAFSGLILTEILLYLWIGILGLPELVGPILNLIITTPINFIVNKLWAFRGTKDEK